MEARVRATVAKASDELARRPGGVERIDRVVELMWETHHEPHYWAAVELWTASRTNDEIADELTDRPAYPMVRDLLLSGMRGVALTYAFDRRDPVGDPHLDAWKRIARLVLDRSS